MFRIIFHVLGRAPGERRLQQPWSARLGARRDTGGRLCHRRKGCDSPSTTKPARCAAARTWPFAGHVQTILEVVCAGPLSNSDKIGIKGRSAEILMHLLASLTPRASIRW